MLPRKLRSCLLPKQARAKQFWRKLVYFKINLILCQKGCKKSWNWQLPLVLNLESFLKKLSFEVHLTSTPFLLVLSSKIKLMWGFCLFLVFVTTAGIQTFSTEIFSYPAGNSSVRSSTLFPTSLYTIILSKNCENESEFGLVRWIQVLQKPGAKEKSFLCGIDLAWLFC